MISHANKLPAGKRYFLAPLINSRSDPGVGTTAVNKSGGWSLAFKELGLSGRNGQHLPQQAYKLERSLRPEALMKTKEHTILSCTALK